MPAKNYVVKDKSGNVVNQNIMTLLIQTTKQSEQQPSQQQVKDSIKAL